MSRWARFTIQHSLKSHLKGLWIYNPSIVAVNLALFLLLKAGKPWRIWLYSYLNFRMKNRTVMGLLLYLCAMSGELYSQSSSEYPQRDTLLTKTHYLKFSIFPFLYSQLYQDKTWLIFHYEGKIGSTPLSYCGVVDYSNYVFKAFVNGTQVSNIPNNIELWLRPQVRYYFSKEALSGFYGGIFPVLLYRDIKSRPLEGYYYGGGLTLGYQQLIKHRYPVEVNFRISSQNGYVNSFDGNGVPIKFHDDLVFGFIELNFGLAFTSKK